METSFEMNMADALTGNGLQDPDEAAFDTSRNERKLGEDHKQMKAAVQFNVRSQSIADATLRTGHLRACFSLG